MASAALTPYVADFLPDGLDIGARSWYIGLARPVALRSVRGRSLWSVRAQPKPPPGRSGGVFLMLRTTPSRAGKPPLYRAPAALIHLIQSRQNAPNATKPMSFCCVRFGKGLLWLQLRLQMCFCPPLGLMLGLLTLTVCKLCRLISGADTSLYMTAISGNSAAAISSVVSGTSHPLTAIPHLWALPVTMLSVLGCPHNQMWCKQSASALCLFMSPRNIESLSIDRGINTSPQTGFYAAKAIYNGSIL